MPSLCLLGLYLLVFLCLFVYSSVFICCLYVFVLLCNYYASHQAKLTPCKALYIQWSSIFVFICLLFVFVFFVMVLDLDFPYFIAMHSNVYSQCLIPKKNFQPTSIPLPSLQSCQQESSLMIVIYNAMLMMTREGEEKAMICFNFEAFIIIGSNDKNF